MIFAYIWKQVVDREKTQTRRVVHPREWAETDMDGIIVAVLRHHRNGTWHERWCVGKTYAIQTERGGPAIARFRLKSICVGRLQDIDPDDVRAEGCHDLEAFKALWDDTHSRPPAWWREFGHECSFPGVKWADNPRVWVLSFELAN